MKLVEILDSENIQSRNIEAWINECINFKEWYSKLGIQPINELEMGKAYIKIIPKNEKANPIDNILSKG